jgi:NAD(P)-dependent dehydrogenase (short-subunit alcohol dehydrogenase family)
VADIAFVTGATRGIGRAAAVALARAGFDVVVTGRTVREGEGRVGRVPVPGSLESTAREIEDLGPRALMVPMDLTDVASVEAAFDQALSAWGRVDVLVNNAIRQDGRAMDRILDIPLDVALDQIVADYLHQLRLIQLAVPGMIERRRGCVIDMSSATTYLDPPAPVGEGGWGLAYTAAKAAFTRVVPILHVEHRDDGVRCFNVDPGFVVTESMRATAGNETYESAGFRGVPPEVPGAVIAWLASAPEADEWRGKMVPAQKVCKQLGLVPGWPPPR